MVFDFGLRLKELRESKNLTQTQVGNMVGVSKTSIFKYENNLASPGVETLKALAVLFRVSTDYLVGLENNEIMILNLDSPEDEIIVKKTIAFLQNELNRVRRLESGTTK